MTSPTLPDDFNPFEHLQDTIRREHNAAVNRYFADLNTNNAWTPNIADPRNSLRTAVQMVDSDTAEMTLIRLWLFEITLKHAQSLQTPIYGIPTPDYQRDIQFTPQVKLAFRERLSSTNTTRTRPVVGEITFRLVRESSETINKSKAQILATGIKREFGSPIFVWAKGHFYYYYRDYDRGYDLRLLVTSKAEGERIARAVLGIQEHPFSADYVDYVENSRTYSDNQGTQIVYGKTVPKPIKRPRADIRFRYAQLFINGRSTVINLVSTPETGFTNVIERLTIT